MYQKEGEKDWLITILKDDKAQYHLTVCIIFWIVFINKIIDLIRSKFYIGVSISIIAIICTFFFMWFSILKAVKKNINMDIKTMYEKCVKCAQDVDKYKFASFDFYTLNQIVEIERKMGEDAHPSECQITIYTSSLDTEENEESVRNVVRDNLEKNVKYRIYYLRGIPTERELKMYGKENLIEYIGDPDENKDLDLAAEFDIIVFQSSSGEIDGYFSINFSTSVAPRPCAQGFICDKQCHYENENLLYKKMRQDSTSLLLYTLREWDNKRKKNEKK